MEAFSEDFDMTFTELFRMTNEKTSEIPVTASNSSNPSSRPEADFCELVWENGQIMMQGQSSKSRTHNSQDVDGLRMNKFSAMDSALIEMGLGNDADIPWLSYPVEDSLQNDYSCDFLPELSGVTINDLPTDNNSAFREKNRSSNMLKPDILRSGVSGVSGDIGSTQDVTSQGFDTSSVAAFTNLRLQKLDPVRQPSTSTSFTNFPYFARPASLARANLVAVNTSENYERGTSTDSMVVNLELDSTKKTLNEENCVNDFQQSHSIDAMKGNEVGMSVEKNKEPVVATTTSVCSANSVDKASNERARDLKRKSRESTESEGPSNEFEDESIGAKKAAHARASSKRSRAAEVHNLSERKRRDRINEKMRALQELIPNCNKVDKASMLDEAIEYLKTLQLQVQMMSMGAGMYMQPMMVPPGLPHFSPMRLGMGFGMNMFGPTHYPVPGGAAPFQGPSLPPYGHPYQGSPMSTHPIIPGVPPPPLNSAMMGLSVSDLAACSRASNLCANDSTQQIRTSSIPNNSMNQATKEGIHPSHSTQDRRPNVNASESPPTAGRTNNVAYTSCHHTKPQKHSMAEIFSPQDMKVDRASGVFPVITSLPGCSSMT